MKRYRATYLLAVGAVTLLASAGSASALPASIQVGPVSTAMETDDVTQRAMTRSTRIATDARARSRRLARSGRLRRARAVLRAGRARANSVRARALRRRADAYAVVTGAGRVVDQRGGIAVRHQATGVYLVTFAGRSGCQNLGAVLPLQTPLGNLGLRAASGNTVTVLNRNAWGVLTNRAFYLAIVC